MELYPELPENVSSPPSIPGRYLDWSFDPPSRTIDRTSESDLSPLRLSVTPVSYLSLMPNGFQTATTTIPVQAWPMTMPPNTAIIPTSIVARNCSLFESFEIPYDTSSPLNSPTRVLRSHGTVPEHPWVLSKKLPTKKP